MLILNVLIALYAPLIGRRGILVLNLFKQHLMWLEQIKLCKAFNNTF